jgi:hypothetical protein
VLDLLDLHDSALTSICMQMSTGARWDPTFLVVDKHCLPTHMHFEPCIMPSIQINNLTGVHPI